MQVTKELIENDIKATEAGVENLKAQLAQTNGALITLKGIKEYLEKPEPIVEQTAETVEVSPAKQQRVDGNGKYVDMPAEGSL